MLLKHMWIKCNIATIENVVRRDGVERSKKRGEGV